jgi:hypothetical protein
VHILHCLITDNFAETGAGISIVGGGDVSVVSSTVTHNVSMDGGGGIEAQLAHWLTIDKLDHKQLGRLRLRGRRRRHRHEHSHGHPQIDDQRQ